MEIKIYNELYEGLTQVNDTFRDALQNIGATFETNDIFSDLDRTKNRLTHAMLGVQPIQRREVDIVGVIDYKHRELRLARRQKEQTYPFSTLDPQYVSFLELQKRTYTNLSTLPLSSVALKTHIELLKNDMVVPEIDEVVLNVPPKVSHHSRRVLEQAFTNSMVMLAHIEEEIGKHGLANIYGANRDDLLQYVQSHAFDTEFNKSVDDLESIIEDSIQEHRTI